MDFHLWAVLHTVMCSHLPLFSSVNWHAEFVNTRKEDSSLFCQPERKSQGLQVWYPVRMLIIVTTHWLGDRVRKQRETLPIDRRESAELWDNLCHDEGIVSVTWGEGGVQPEVRRVPNQRGFLHTLHSTPGEQWRNEQLPWWSVVTASQNYKDMEMSFFLGRHSETPKIDKNKYGNTSAALSCSTSILMSTKWSRTPKIFVKYLKKSIQWCLWHIKAPTVVTRRANVHSGAASSWLIGLNSKSRMFFPIILSG